MADNIYVLGRGKLFFAPFLLGTQTPDGERYMGNSPGFSLTNEVESLDHFNSDEGVGEKDGSVSLRANRSGSLTVDNINKHNLALFFFGSAITVTHAGATVADEPLTVKKGLAYQLGATAQNPAGVRSISAVTVTGAGGTPTYVAGTDYTVELDLGRLLITEGSGIADSTPILVDYTVATSSRSRVISGNTPIEGMLHYISKNPAGEDRDYLMPWVKLTPAGEFSLKEESDWQQLPFSIEVLKKSNIPAIFADGRAVA